MVGQTWGTAATTAAAARTTTAASTATSASTTSRAVAVVAIGLGATHNSVVIDGVERTIKDVVGHVGGVVLAPFVIVTATAGAITVAATTSSITTSAAAASTPRGSPRGGGRAAAASSRMMKFMGDDIDIILQISNCLRAKETDLGDVGYIPYILI